eukprot:scaffold257286_cov68-Attheya_sp.AAC.4
MELYKLSHLVELNIHGNYIMGSVPEEICDHKGTPLADQVQHFDDNWGISILNLMENNVQCTIL